MVVYLSSWAESVFVVRCWLIWMQSACLKWEASLLCSETFYTSSVKAFVLLYFCCNSSTKKNKSEQHYFPGILQYLRFRKFAIQQLEMLDYLIPEMDNWWLCTLQNSQKNGFQEMYL